ncbi:MAG: SDR family oxidoreductase [Nitrospiraceae bacterium]|nr:SDR family oxidoreductase [Nitrospiraceae bacterium]
MKIVIFGASGRTGRHLVRQALDRGHAVTAFVRDPAKPGISHGNLSLFKGDALHPGEVEAAVKGREAVLSALGFSKGSPQTICADGIRHIISAMEKHGVKRLIAESAYGAGNTRKKGFYARLLWLLIKDRMRDKEEMERQIEGSGLAWVIARPVALTDGEKAGPYRAGPGLKPGLFPTVSRAGVADFMLSQLESDRFIHEMPTVSR